MLDNLYMKSSDKTLLTTQISYTMPPNQIGRIVFCATAIIRDSLIGSRILSPSKNKINLSHSRIYIFLVITIDRYYWKYNHKCYYARQAEKEAFESHFQKQGKASSASNAMASQNNTNIFLVTLFAKSFSFNKLSPTPKKQSNSLQVDLFYKLANNSKSTGNKYKKCFKNNLYPKKQTTVTSKDYGVSIATD